MNKEKAKNVKRDECISDEHLEYLDGLRESGVTNMWGAGAYVEKVFGVDKSTARTIVLYWMDTF